MKDVLYINGYDAFLRYGIILSEGAISALITPASMKDYITINSRLEDGTRYVTDSHLLKQSERSISLPFYIRARSRQDMYTKLNALCEEVLYKGSFTLKTKYANYTYTLIYKSCSQMQDFNGRAGKFSLSVIEPNPTKR